MRHEEQGIKDDEEPVSVFEKEIADLDHELFFYSNEPGEIIPFEEDLYVSKT